MSTLSLTHIHHQSIDTMSWCATAMVSCTITAPLVLQLNAFTALRPYLAAGIDAKNLSWQKLAQQPPLSVLKVACRKRQQQRDGVRLLLQYLLDKLNLIDTLEDSKFPYRLSTSRYYVCFSHTDKHDERFTRDSVSTSAYSYKLQSKVAVAISQRQAVGIDIESQLIAWHIIQRYYHINELTLLNQLSVAQRDIVGRYLWQFKESLIKIHNYKLAQGLGMDYSPLLLLLIDTITTYVHGSSDIIIDTTLSLAVTYRIVILPEQQTLIVI